MRACFWHYRSASEHSFQIRCYRYAKVHHTHPKQPLLMFMGENAYFNPSEHTILLLPCFKTSLPRPRRTFISFFAPSEFIIRTPPSIVTKKARRASVSLAEPADLAHPVRLLQNSNPLSGNVRLRDHFNSNNVFLTFAAPLMLSCWQETGLHLLLIRPVRWELHRWGVPCTRRTLVGRSLCLVRTCWKGCCPCVGLYILQLIHGVVSRKRSMWDMCRCTHVPFCGGAGACISSPNASVGGIARSFGGVARIMGSVFE